MEQKAMPEVHGITEGSIVKVTEVSGELFDWLQEGVRLEVRSIRESVRSKKVIVTFASGKNNTHLPIYHTVVASTWNDGPEPLSGGLHFNADASSLRYNSKYFDVELEE